MQSKYMKISIQFSKLFHLHIAIATSMNDNYNIGDNNNNLKKSFT